MSAFTPPLSQFAFAVKVRSPTILDTVTGAVDVDAEGGLGLTYFIRRVNCNQNMVPLKAKGAARTLCTMIFFMV